MFHGYYGITDSKEEVMWEIFTHDTTTLTMHYRISSGLAMRSEHATLPEIRHRTTQLGAPHRSQLAEVERRLILYRETIDALHAYMPFDVALICGHYVGIEPVEETKRIVHKYGGFGN